MTKEALRRPVRGARVSGLLLAVVIVAGTPAFATETVPSPDAGDRASLMSVPASASALLAPQRMSLLLVEASDGQHLVAVAEDQRRPIASTVKLLTALTVVDSLPRGSLVTVGREVIGVEGALFGLRPGEVWSVEDLLAALLLRSGNEVAAALAVATAGDEAAFVRRMEEVLDALGVVDVSLGSASGLSVQDAMSAAELAVVARAALAEPRIAELVGLKGTVVAGGQVAIENRNLLLGRYEGTTGLKTGFTSAAGYTLAASARRDGRELIAIVLGAASEDQRLQAASTLLDHGFSSTTRREIAGTIELRSGAGPVMWRAGGTWLTVPQGSRVVLDWPVALRPGDVVTRVAVRIDDRSVGEVDVVRADARVRDAGGVPLGGALAEGVYTSLRAAGLAGRLG